jgi:hypothetical protein
MGLWLDSDHLLDRVRIVRDAQPLPAPTSMTRPLRPASSSSRCAAAPAFSAAGANLP